VHSRTDSTKSYQKFSVVVVIVRWALGGFWTLWTDQLRLFCISSAIAIALTVLEVKEKIGLGLLEQTWMSLSLLNAFTIFCWLYRIDLACLFRPFLPAFAMLAQFPAIIAPGRLPAIAVVA